MYITDRKCSIFFHSGPDEFTKCSSAGPYLWFKYPWSSSSLYLELRVQLVDILVTGRLVPNIWGTGRSGMVFEISTTSLWILVVLGLLKKFSICPETSHEARIFVCPFRWVLGMLGMPTTPQMWLPQILGIWQSREWLVTIMTCINPRIKGTKFDQTSLSFGVGYPWHVWEM